MAQTHIDTTPCGCGIRTWTSPGLAGLPSLQWHGALALSLILVELHSYELRHAAITRRNAAGSNAACYVNDVPAGHPIAVLLGEEMSQVGIEEGERETHCLPAAPRTPSPFGKVGSFFKHAKKPDQ